VHSRHENPGYAYDDTIALIAEYEVVVEVWSVDNAVHHLFRSSFPDVI